MDLSVYDKIDPDDIYHLGDNTITFFYTPETDELFYDVSGRIHQEMLEDDDKLFNAVFPKLANLPEYKKRLYKSRGQALKHSNALLGRMGMYDGDFLIALWQPANSPGVPEFRKKLLEMFPDIAKTSPVLVGSDQHAKFLLQPDKQKAIAPKLDKKFLIGGHSYTEKDLQKIKTSHHTKSMPIDATQAVLCHPDMKKYPELRGYELETCPTPEKTIQRTKSREINSYLYKYGESFRDWLSNSY